jgi:hypothetical protein
LTNKISKKQIQLFSIESIDIKQLIVKIFQNKIQKSLSVSPDEKGDYEDFKNEKL